MLIGMIRPTATANLPAHSHVQADLRDGLERQVPAGHELTHARVEMVKGSTELIGHGRYRSAEFHEIEADDMTALRAKVPEGWQLLNVRSV
ncbi:MULTISPECIES: hypothetical protein [Actinomycetes]|uniref:hypothetical protein n=1 Tax=Actinomycetes TaxID=1760 RepID=UPI003416E17C